MWISGGLRLSALLVAGMRVPVVTAVDRILWHGCGTRSVLLVLLASACRARASSRQPGIARPRGGPAAALDATGHYVAKLCRRAAVW